MLSKAKEKLISELHTKKGRDKLGLCLVEGHKPITTAGKSLKFTFKRSDTDRFDKLVTTETPQDIAGVAQIPKWSLEDVKKSPTIVVLDGVQDPGNIGSILRLCLGFNASLILVDSADVTNPKVIRASTGTMFQVPWIQIKRTKAQEIITNINQPIYRLELKRDSKILNQKIMSSLESKLTIIAGSEGSGITLKTPGTSLVIPHSLKLESLNVTHALAIFLHSRHSRKL